MLKIAYILVILKPEQMVQKRMLDMVTKFPKIIIIGIKAPLSDAEVYIVAFATTLVLNVERPSPKTLLKRGAAKHPVRAISGNPFFAIDVFAMKSPIEFPQANTVRANKVGGTFKISPRILSKSMRIYAVDQIQNTLIANEKSCKNRRALTGALLLFVLNLIIKPTIAARPRATH